MFINRTYLIHRNPAQFNYGIAVTDVDGDGAFEWLVAGYGFPNTVLKWTGSRFDSVTPLAVADAGRQAIGVAACDMDGDGDEEIYILNSDTFAGQKLFSDRLFDRAGGEWTDLFALPVHRAVVNLTAGRSVIGVDRNGTGLYGFFIASYGGPMRLYELDEDGHLMDVAPQVGLDLQTGGRSAMALPLITPRLDIFAANEGGANFLFLNTGEGMYEEVATHCGLSDPFQNARGIAALDANDDGLFDVVCGNWEGQSRLFIQTLAGTFEDQAPPEMAAASRVRTVIAADFDNDGYEEIFFNNIGQPNLLFARRNGAWKSITVGEATEPGGLGTGAAVADMDGDGRLELLIAHGESGMQPLTLYHVLENENHWLRILPFTQYGAPARGALVTLVAGGRTQRRVVDCGSGYLCQMEPVAHFGLGVTDEIERVEVRWPDGASFTLNQPGCDQMIKVQYPL
ncbi:MAG: CRTAC1 family protein [Anaerolineae bacterium]